jgi:hypothetical protein
VNAVDARRIDLRQGGGEQVGLLLVIAFDCHAVAGRDDRFELRRRPLQQADLSSRMADGPKPREAVVAARRCSIGVAPHGGSSSQPVVVRSLMRS